MQLQARCLLTPTQKTPPEGHNKLCLLHSRAAVVCSSEIFHISPTNQLQSPAWSGSSQQGSTPVYFSLGSFSYHCDSLRQEGLVLAHSMSTEHHDGGGQCQVMSHVMFIFGSRDGFWHSASFFLGSLFSPGPQPMDGSAHFQGESSLLY